jgi:hypothetical protein
MQARPLKSPGIDTSTAKYLPLLDLPGLSS